jgi:hypothetical protein
MSATMAKKKNPTGERDRHKNRLIGLRAPPAVYDVLKEHADSTRRSVAQAVLLLVEEILIQKGMLPPPKGGSKE